MLDSVIAVMLALACLELGLRFVTTGLPDLPAPSAFMPSRGPCAPEITLRQYYEGISAAHYCSDGARVTSNRSLQNGPFGVLLGDSFVQAAQVGDDATAGSLIERMAGSEGFAINVRQYGWSGAGAPVYVAVADRIIKVLNPLWVAVVLSQDDLGTRGIEESYYWRGRVNEDLSLAVFEAGGSGRSSSRGLPSASPALTRILRKSALICMCVYKLRSALVDRAADAVTPSITPADERVNQAIVHSLKGVLGDRLLLVYVPRVEINRAEPAGYEDSLSSACRKESVRFVSLRQDMLRARDNDHQLCTGFSNSTLGEGHLNRYGHAALARAVLRMLHQSGTL